MATLEPEQTFITSDESLDALCDQLINSSVIAIDTEFMGEEHFIPPPGVDPGRSGRGGGGHRLPGRARDRANGPILGDRLRCPH
ncbi:MAG: hypothetical protein IPM88_13635 [Nitrospira sp.]|nr:hypothetical protein [Nitrospira sp.]